jgi:class 3 adenylate cyclase
MAAREPIRESTDSGFRRAVLSSEGRAAEQARTILDEQMKVAFFEGQRGFNLARAIVCGAFLARELVSMALSGHAARLDVFVTVMLTIAVAWSLLYLRLMKAPTVISAGTGATLDIVLFTSLMAALIAWHDGDGYDGLWTHPAPHSIALLVAANGLRFNRGLVLWTTALSLLSLVALAALDRHMWGAQLAYGATEVGFDVVLVLCAAVVALVFRARAQQMAERVARRALDAVRTKEKLGRYLGKEVASAALALDEIKLGGVRQPIAVLFSDLRGFTSAAEAVPPEVLVDQLNAYLEEMVRCIESEGGVVDKYLGDGIMAVFGAPIAHPDDAARAIAAARKMQRALARHNEERARRGLWTLEHGIGVHYGPAVAGHIGTAEHAQYTVVGDVVNVAARLEGMTKAHGKGVLVSMDAVTAARASAAVDDVEPMGSLPVRGRVQPLEVVALKG